MPGDDPFHLQRFLDAQSSTYSQARAELAAGEKRSHWMWFIFPQIAGLGRSAMAQAYAISDLAEAQAYLAHPVAERLVPTIADVAKKGGFDVIAVTASSYGKDIAPRVAARLGDPDCDLGRHRSRPQLARGRPDYVPEDEAGR